MEDSNEQTSLPHEISIPTSSPLLEPNHHLYQQQQQQISSPPLQLSPSSQPISYQQQDQSTPFSSSDVNNSNNNDNYILTQTNGRTNIKDPIIRISANTTSANTVSFDKIPDFASPTIQNGSILSSFSTDTQIQQQQQPLSPPIQYPPLQQHSANMQASTAINMVHQHDHRMARPLRRNSSIMSTSTTYSVQNAQYIQRYYIPQNPAGVIYPPPHIQGQPGRPPHYQGPPGAPSLYTVRPAIPGQMLSPPPIPRPINPSAMAGIPPHASSQVRPNQLRQSISLHSLTVGHLGSNPQPQNRMPHPQFGGNIVVRPHHGIHNPPNFAPGIPGSNTVMARPANPIPAFTTIPINARPMPRPGVAPIFTRIGSATNMIRPMYRPSILMRPRKNSAAVGMSIPIRFSSFQRIETAFLSKVAKYFRDHVVVNTEVIETIEYRDCFTGKHAVDILSELVARRDRNIALILGRALEVQFFFHDVNWHNRLLDVKDRIYEFDSSTLFKNDEGQLDLPTGVFIPFTKCYSPTCSGKGCYSMSCPFKQEQIALVKNQSVQLIENSSNVLADMIQDDSTSSSASYWSTYAPKDIVERMAKDQLTKQEVIYELIQSEKNYVYGLEIIFDTFRDVIRKSSVINPAKREEFLSSLFINRQALLAAHRKLLQRLLQKQKESYVVMDVGTVFLNQLADFENYAEYGKHEPYARWIFTEEKENNKQFADFLSEFQRDPRNKRAEFDHYLRLPSTRFAGYRLQIDRIIKYTPSDDEEYPILQKVSHALTEIGKKSNIQGGKTVDHIKILQFRKSTELTNAESKILNLQHLKRQIVRSGSVTIKRVTSDLSVDYTLFDHVLVFLSKKKAERRKVYKRIYPLQLVRLKGDELVSSMQSLHTHDTASTDSSSDDNVSLSSGVVGHIKPGSVAKPGSILSGTSSSTSSALKEGKFTVDLEILGAEKVSYRLVFKTDAEKVSWQKAVMMQKEALEMQNMLFKVGSVGSIHLDFRLYSSCIYDEMIFLGHDRGILVATQTETETMIRHVLDLSKVTHVQVLASNKCLIALSDKTLYSFDIDVLLSDESNSTKMSNAEKISTGVAFFELGCLFDKSILCSVKNGSLDSRIKLYEPRETKVEKKRGFGGVFKGISYSSWNYFEELYIPSIAFGLQFLRNRLCIACTKGYEIVDLNSLHSQSLLDLSDERLRSITARDNCRSMSLFKVSEGKFLLCYNVFGFFVDQYGRCSSSEYMTWQGEPLKFLFHSPYLICFTQSFIEIHDVNRCELLQIIPGEDLALVNEELKHFISLDDSDKLYLYELLPNF